MGEIKVKKSYLIGAALLVILIIGGILAYNMVNQNPQVIIETSKGNLLVELYPKEAPITVENFLMYVDEGYYNGLIFHRVIEGFMIQGGGFNTDGIQKATKDSIALESDNGLKNDKGTLAMARTNIPDSATAQFFINVEDNDFLNYNPGNPGYAVFGKVVEGMNVVEEIESVNTATRGSFQDWPTEDVMIISIKRA